MEFSDLINSAHSATCYSFCIRIVLHLCLQKCNNIIVIVQYIKNCLYLQFFHQAETRPILQLNCMQSVGLSQRKKRKIMFQQISNCKTMSFLAQAYTDFIKTGRQTSQPEKKRRRAEHSPRGHSTMRLVAASVAEVTAAYIRVQLHGRMRDKLTM